MKKPKRKASIGVFDSGFGGLIIMKEIVRKLPEYNYIYLGDTARTPYGNRSQEVIYKFTEQAVESLFRAGCHLIILACNSASSEALRKIQQKYLPKHYPERRVLGVIIPAAETASKITNNNRIGVLGTESTVNSGAFKKEIKKLNRKITIFQRACPLLVPIIEAGEEKFLTTDLILKNYLDPLIKKHIDTLILGCTHYGLLKNKIRKIVGPRISIVAEEKILAARLEDYLKKHAEIEKVLAKDNNVNFLTTDLTDKFRILGSKFLGQRILPKKIQLT